MKKIILGTESAYKKSLFRRLNLEFESAPPKIDESPRANETAMALAQRLAREKAEHIFDHGGYNDSWVIGADQTAEADQVVIGKPGTHAQAVADLTKFSGNEIFFFTAACVLSPAGECFEMLDKTQVRFRELTAEEIENYLRIEQPYDCAGAFKSEGLGITLFESIESSDPSALIGLPLIQLASILRAQGFDCYAS